MCPTIHPWTLYYFPYFIFDRDLSNIYVLMCASPCLCATWLYITYPGHISYSSPYTPPSLFFIPCNFVSHGVLIYMYDAVYSTILPWILLVSIFLYPSSLPLCTLPRGLVTYREVDLMIDEHKASSQQKQRVSTIICHELAHQVP